MRPRPSGGRRSPSGVNPTRSANATDTGRAPAIWAGADLSEANVIALDRIEEVRLERRDNPSCRDREQPAGRLCEGLGRLSLGHARTQRGLHHHRPGGGHDLGDTASHDPVDLGDGLNRQACRHCLRELPRDLEVEF